MPDLPSVPPPASASAVAPPAAHPSQFALLRQRRFGPFFWTQFTGAGNDNMFKFAFTVMVTYQLSIGWLPPVSSMMSGERVVFTN